ncbi:hypothetical protein, partial [Serratia marcescens]|uniref:hypothetical protein n=1 Tax=Serratia marcescens TaxID=615 RepID=UPI001C37E3B8
WMKPCISRWTWLIWKRISLLSSQRRLSKDTALPVKNASSGAFFYGVKSMICHLKQMVMRI